MTPTPEDSAYLRHVLNKRFSLDELKSLAFDIGVDYECLVHNTKDNFSRELIKHLERRTQLNVLVTEILKTHQEDVLIRLLARLPSSQPNNKVQIILSPNKLENAMKFKEVLAQVFDVEREDLNFIALASGNSVRLLVGIPKPINFQSVMTKRRLVGNEYQILSMSKFESLNPVSQNIWRLVASKWPPVLAEGIMFPAISWSNASKAYLKQHQEIYDENEGGGDDSAEPDRHFSEKEQQDESVGDTFQTKLGEADEEIPPPFSYLDQDHTRSKGPVPGHEKQSGRFVWLQVKNQDKNFLQEIEQGNWLLVDTDAAERGFERGELLIILKDDTVKDGITFEQRALERPIPYHYLARFEGKTADRQQSLVMLSSELEQMPVNEAQIYGYVVGVWSFYRNVLNRGR